MTVTQAATNAAQYLRMSTEHQRYSLENQAAVIGVYAGERGFHIVRTYTDAGKSGLTLRGRFGLQRLLSDALNPDRDFSTILVLDVSRWGRFQDVDQAAHYEFICRDAGVQVVYCGEMFDNDGGLVSSIAKSLKRVMAGEYSRELSAKVTRAKVEQAKLGFRQGGPILYGFRRELIDQDGTPRQILRAGEYKGLHTDRVRTVPGPPEEQQVIRRIFNLFIADKGSFQSVANRLNAEGVADGMGRRWDAGRISRIIRNELCIGVAIYNRTTRPLRRRSRSRPQDEWVRVNVCRPIVTRALFEKANRLASRGRRRYSQRELLSRLRQIVRKYGHVGPRLLKLEGAPDEATYVRHFGSLARACDRVGLRPPGRRIWQPETQGYWSDARILEALRQAHAKYGFISSTLMRCEPTLPSPSTVAFRFGSVVTAYAEAGIAISDRQANPGAWATKPLEERARRGGKRGPTRPPLSDEELLSGLRAKLRERGQLSAKVILQAPELRSPVVYRRQFGSLRRAYALAGYKPSRRQQSSFDCQPGQVMTAQEAEELRRSIVR